MCCFSVKTIEVHGTKIFARKKTADTQTLVYQMTYSAKAPTAMILPLPIARAGAAPPGDDAVRWTSLKDYPTFFDALATGFPPPVTVRSTLPPQAAAAAAPLEVHEVGDFIASFVPSVDDFGGSTGASRYRRTFGRRSPRMPTMASPCSS